MDQRVKNGGLAGALAFVLLTIFGMVAPDTAAGMPTGLEAALTTLFSTGIAFFVPRSADQAPT